MNLKEIIILVVVLGLVAVFLYQSFKDSKEAKRRACDTVSVALNGKIVAFGGRNTSQYVVLDNVKESMGVTFSQQLSRVGFRGDYGFAIGDSVIKSAGSRSITFKRGDSVAVFTLDCGE